MSTVRVEKDNESFGNNPYSVYNAMQCPKQIGKVNKVKFESIVDTLGNNFQSYITGYPFSGVQGDYRQGKTEKSGFYEGPDIALGKNYFTKLGQICSADSESVCRGKPIETYIRNIPTGKVPLFNDMTFQGITGCEIRGVTEGRGLIPGIFEDISDISPWALADKLSGQGNVMGSRCEIRKLPVGTHIYDPQMRGKTWEFEQKCTNSLYYNKPGTTEGSVFHVPGARGPFSEDISNRDDETETFQSEIQMNEKKTIPDKLAYHETEDITDNLLKDRINTSKKIEEVQKSIAEAKQLQSDDGNKNIGNVALVKSISTPIQKPIRSFLVLYLLFSLLMTILCYRVFLSI